VSERIGAVLSPPVDHLSAWLGGWPPALPVRVVQDREYERPGWDGTARGVAGVVDPQGRCVVRLPPEVAARLEVPLPDVATLLAALPAAVGVPGTAGAGVLRWAQDVPDRDVLPDVGIWLPAALADDGDPRVPVWLRPFGGDVLVALDEDGRYLGGVGLKRHHDSGREIAVVTDERARGRGLARRLVAQAARKVLAEGRAVVYLHAPDNEASARVARASGFPDTGWQVIGYWVRQP
jgi:GNAT superfamily N-acetyltransferase